MKNNFTISQRNAIVENHLWCIKAVMKQNHALIRAAKLDTDDVYQQLALRLIRAVFCSSMWSCAKICCSRSPFSGSYDMTARMSRSASC